MFQFRLLLFVSLLSSLWLEGCATPPHASSIQDQNLSIGELKHIVKDFLPVGVRKLSANGREYTSEYFVYENNEYKAPTDKKFRFFCKIEIMNTSRPFDIMITAFREVRDDRPSGYRFVSDGPDVRLAKLLKQQLRDRLAKRRDDLNVLDDFKVF